MIVELYSASAACMEWRKDGEISRSRGLKARLGKECSMYLFWLAGSTEVKT